MAYTFTLHKLHDRNARVVLLKQTAEFEYIYRIYLHTRLTRNMSLLDGAHVTTQQPADEEEDMGARDATCNDLISAVMV